jgi:nitrogen regulatory protein PII 2
MSIMSYGSGRGNRATRPCPEIRKADSVRREVGVYIMQQRGIIRDADDPKYPVPVQKEIELGFLPKKMLMIMVDNDEVPLIVDTLTQINRSGQQGDGKIFVCPVTAAVRIRTGERGNKALS